MKYEFQVTMTIESVPNHIELPYTPLTREQAKEILEKTILGDDYDWGCHLTNDFDPYLGNNYPIFKAVKVE